MENPTGAVAAAPTVRRLRVRRSGRTSTLCRTRKPLAEPSLGIAYVPVRPEEGDLYGLWRDAAPAPLGGAGSGRPA
jgi:hypothetical protein